MTRDFDQWLGTFRESINSFGYYADFPKIIKNVDEIRIELNILNALIGRKNIEEEFVKIVTEYPKVVGCIPVLIASHEKRLYAQQSGIGKMYDFAPTRAMSITDYQLFMRATGLFDLLQNHLTSNLVDYVFGVETGLDSNARKNRGGHQMESLVEAFIEETGFAYTREMKAAAVQKQYGIRLDAMTNNGKTVKRFDFVVTRQSHVYVFEVNFYGGGGSKLNETARSYKELALEARKIENFTFVWITDGKGWESAKNNLRETFDVLPTLYNIKDLEDGVLNRELFRSC